MKRKYLFIVILLFNFLPLYGQTIEDITKLGLTDSQLRSSFEKRLMLLTNTSTGKSKKIKEGGFATIKMKGDTAKMELILEAFLSDTIIASSLTPQLTGKEIKLGFSEFKLLPIQDIESIEYSVRHINRTYWTGFLMTLVGLEFAVLPVVMPLILGNAEETYSRPQFPYIVAGGVILYICGWRLQKSLVPKEYKLGTEWSYRVMEK